MARRDVIIPLLALLVTFAAALSPGCERRTAPVAPMSTVAAACPPEMALVPAESGSVCVDKYEAALEGRRFSHAIDDVDAGTLRATPAKGIKPQVNISEVEAEAACAGASKRLCTEVEWRAACDGPQKLVYPYGNEHVAGACNDGRPRPAASIGAAGNGGLDDPRLAEAPNGIEPGGSFPRCVSAYGVEDMHGNVHEWVSTSPKPEDPRYGMFLGGYFADASENGPGCTYKTTAHFKEYHDYSTGFRCCKSP